MSELISLLVLILVTGVAVWLLLWLAAQLPLSVPLRRAASAVVIAIAAVVFLSQALPLAGVRV